MSKKKTVFHPTIPGVTREVDSADEWKAAGWRLTDPGIETPAPAPVALPTPTK